MLFALKWNHLQLPGIRYVCVGSQVVVNEEVFDLRAEAELGKYTQVLCMEMESG